MQEHTYLAALIGGVMIGLAACTLLALLGRIAGISSIAAGLLVPATPRSAWRYAFVTGLIAGGVLLRVWSPAAFGGAHPHAWPLVVLGGLLVGYGTRLGSGCTSGHGVCGLARRSRRSVFATLAFMTSGMLTVTLLRYFAGR